MTFTRRLESQTESTEYSDPEMLARGESTGERGESDEGRIGAGEDDEGCGGEPCCDVAEDGIDDDEPPDGEEVRDDVA